MRFNDQQIESLRTVIADAEIDCSDEELQSTGVAVIRFALAKMKNDKEINTIMENNRNG